MITRKRVLACRIILLFLVEFCQIVDCDLIAFDGNSYLLRRPERSMGAVYIFSDYKSCFTCNITINSIAAYCKQKKFPCIVFLSGYIDSGTERLIARDLSQVDSVITDELGVYQKYYDVETVPTLLVLDKFGQVEYSGTPGSVGFGSDDLKRVIERVRSQRMISDNYALAGIDTLTSSESWIIRSQYTLGSPYGTTMVYQPLANQYVMMHTTEKRMFFLSSEGAVRREISAQPTNVKYISTTPLIIGSSLDPSKFVLYDTDLRTAETFVTRINVNDTSLEDLELPGDAQSLTQRFKYRCSDSLLMYSRRNDDGGGSFNPDSSIVSWSNNNDRGSVGRYSAKYYYPETAGWAWAASEPVDSLIAIHVNFDDTVRLYSMYGELVKAIPLNIPESVWTGVERDNRDADSILAKYSIHSSYWFRFRTYDLHFDPVAQQLLLTVVVKCNQLTQTRSQPGCTDTYGVIVQFDVNSSEQRNMFQLPKNTVVHGAYDRHLYGVQSINGKQYLFLARY